MRLSFASLLCMLLMSFASFAANTPQPMDSAAMGTQPHLPDTVTPDGMHVGSWSAGDAKTSAVPAQKPQTQAAPAQGQTQAANESSSESPSADGDEKIEPGHSMVVTSIQTCYDQLDPADAADIKKNFLKPYEECQARLQAKLAGKRDLKQGETQNAATPETPRNYQRVAEPEKAPAPPTP